MESTDKTADLLRLLTDRCVANLAQSVEAQRFLRGNGVTDERIWTQYRLGAGDKSFLAGLDTSSIERLKSIGLVTWNNRLVLAGAGICIPTYDPRQPDQPVGFVRVNASQGQHRFATSPAGVACPGNIDGQQRIVIADAPLLCLRLAQAGAAGVILAEAPEVMPPLTDWLKRREIIVTAYKNDGLEALRSALDALGIQSTAALAMVDLARTGGESLRLLGVKKDDLLARRLPAEPITPNLVSALTEFAQKRLADGDGVDLLRQLEADIPDLVSAYGLGYLPADFRSALPKQARRSLGIGAVDRKLRLGNAIIVPAVDRAGVPVDLLAICADRITMLLDDPAGLLGAKVAVACEEIAVVDSFGLLVQHWKEGQRNVLLLRGPQDAKVNAERLYQSGVRFATILTRRDTDEIAHALKSAGIAIGRKTITVPTPIKPPERIEVPDTSPQTTVRPSLQSHDAKSGVATFNAGDAVYTLEVPYSGDTRIEVKLERAGQIALDKFDLAVEAQRKRFATSAALRTGIAFETVMEHLLHLLQEARRLRDEQLSPAKVVKIEVPPEERAEAISFLKRPDLLETIAADLESLGWVGESSAKAILYMTATSRKLPEPLWAALRATSGAGKSFGLDLIAQLTPPEELIHLSRLTDAALYYQDANSLSHKLLLIDEADTLTRDVIIALRVLKTRGALSLSHVQRDGAGGQTRTCFVEARGPVAVLTSTAGHLDSQLLSRCYDLPVDETPEQTERILATQRQLRSTPAFDGTRARLVRLHRNIQRLLEVRPVTIPFATRIAFPATSVQHRRAQERFLALIAASAVLHQHQRLRDGEHVVADLRDFEIALKLAAQHLAGLGRGLSVHARELLDALQAEAVDTFTMVDLARIRPHWSRQTFRTVLKELLALEYIASLKTGRGRLRQYGLTAGYAPERCIGIHLRGAVGELVEVGSGGLTNLSPETATG